MIIILLLFIFLTLVLALVSYYDVNNSNIVINSFFYKCFLILNKTSRYLYFFTSRLLFVLIFIVGIVVVPGIILTSSWSFLNEKYSEVQINLYSMVIQYLIMIFIIINLFIKNNINIDSIIHFIVNRFNIENFLLKQSVKIQNSHKYRGSAYLKDLAKVVKNCTKEINFRKVKKQYPKVDHILYIMFPLIFTILILLLIIVISPEHIYGVIKHYLVKIDKTSEDDIVTTINTAKLYLEFIFNCIICLFLFLITYFNFYYFFKKKN